MHATIGACPATPLPRQLWSAARARLSLTRPALPAARSTRPAPRIMPRGYRNTKAFERLTGRMLVLMGVGTFANLALLVRLKSSEDLQIAGI